MIRLRNIKLILAGMLILPMGLATVACSPLYADDPNRTQTDPLATVDSITAEINIEELEARIQTAIQNEEITQDQVDRTISLLKEEFAGHDKNSAKLESLKAEIATAVESGEITQEEADAKLAGLEEGKKKSKKWHGKRHHHKKPMMDIEEIKAEIATAVESGEITQEEADAKLAGLEEGKKKSKKWHGKRHHHKKPMMDIEEIKAEIATAVESGEITQEEADAKLTDIESKRNALQDKMAAKLESIKAEIAAAVESGEITQEEADAKLAGLEQGKEKGKKCHGKRHQHKKPMMDIEEIKAKISAAVESGEITQEEASNKLLHLERQPKKVTY